MRNMKRISIILITLLSCLSLPNYTNAITTKCYNTGDVINYSLSGNAYKAGIITISNWTDFITVLDRNLWAQNIYDTGTKMKFSYDWWWDSNDVNAWDIITNVTERQWPCPEWYHIPSRWEWLKIFSIFNYERENIQDSLYISKNMTLWTNTPLKQWLLNAYKITGGELYIGQNRGNINDDEFSIRCLKNSPAEYTIKFDTHWGTLIENITWYMWKTIEAPIVPNKSWFSFNWWYIDTWYTTEWNFIIDRDRTVHAKWKCYDWYKLSKDWSSCEKAEYTIKFETNWWSPIENITWAAGTKLTKSIIPNYSWNYMFDGWYINNNCSFNHPENCINEWNLTIDDDRTVYAKRLPFSDLTVRLLNGLDVTIMDRNLWATEKGTWANSYWKYFQWWNNYGFTTAKILSTNKVEASEYNEDWKYYYSNTFITGTGRWTKNNDLNLWWGSWENEHLTNLDLNKQWPCPVWYHIPNIHERKALYGLLWIKSSSQWVTKLQQLIFLPFAWYHSTNSSKIKEEKESWSYWSVTPTSSEKYAYYFTINVSSIEQKNQHRERGNSIRCFKDTPSFSITYESNWWDEIKPQTWIKRWFSNIDGQDPTRENSSFSGRFLDKTLTESFTFSGLSYITGDIKLYAKWWCNSWYKLSDDWKKCELWATKVEILNNSSTNEYVEWDKLDMHGLKIYVEYSNWTTWQITYDKQPGFIFSPSEWTILSENDNSVAITYKGKTVYQPIIVKRQTRYSWWWSRKSSIKTATLKTDEKDIKEINSINDEKNNNEEMKKAYYYAYNHWITTTDTYGNANMEGTLTRIAMAKMLSQYAINVLGRTPNTGRNATFTDVTAQMDADYNDGVTLAYQLGIMGINLENGKYRPNDLVTRAEFGTALSRLLYGTEDGKDNYYTTHLAVLFEKGIITNTNASLQELRGYVMLMLMRTSK